MSNLKCIVIDDDPTITDLISHFCDKHHSVEYCIECNNPIDGLKLISSQEFDIVFLDYNMPHLTGEELISLKQDGSKVIMITSYNSFAVDSYKYPQIVNYLLKPVTYDRFNLALSHLMSSQPKSRSAKKKPKKPKKSIMVKEGNKCIPIKVEDILYIKSESNYSTLCTKNQKIMSLITLKDLIEKLPPHFLRIHRSFIVNSQHIEFYTAEEIGIAGNQLPVSGKYRSEIKKYVNSFD